MADKGKAPAGRAGMTQVEINACWVEAVRKENKGRVLNENFDFNPKNCKSPFYPTSKPTAKARPVVTEKMSSNCLLSSLNLVIAIT